MTFGILQNKSKKTRYECEKKYMEILCSIGCGIGEYIRNDLGESEAATPAPMLLMLVL